VRPRSAAHPSRNTLKPGDWIVLWACLAGLLIIAALTAAYILSHP